MCKDSKMDPAKFLLFEKYKKHMLGIVCDMGFGRQGEQDDFAGYRFGCKVKNEDRFIIVGFSENPRLLVVCHCYRENDEEIRIISARKATKKEAATYGKRK